MEQNDLKMIESLELYADNEKSLVIEVYNNLEAVVTLKNKETTRKLGKEDFEIVINRFINALETKEHKDTDHAIDGNMVFKICCLKPDNYSITGKYTDDKLIIYISEDDIYNMSIDKMELSEKLKIKWLSDLVILSLKLKNLKDQRRKKNRRKKWFEKLIRMLERIKKLIQMK
jgi:hypothetical protein